MSKTAALLYQVKITLKDIDPPIWRRLLVSSETKLSKFHDIIQASMGWTDSHLHRFKIGVVCFSYPYEPGDLEEMTAIDSRFVKLIHIVPPIRPFQGTFHFAFDYEYDFGDSWEHEVLFEDVLPPDPKLLTWLAAEGASCSRTMSTPCRVISTSVSGQRCLSPA